MALIPDTTLHGPNVGPPLYVEEIPAEQRGVYTWWHDGQRAEASFIHQGADVPDVIMAGMNEKEDLPPVGVLWVIHFHKSLSSLWGSPFLFVMRRVRGREGVNH